MGCITFPLIAFTIVVACICPLTLVLLIPAFIVGLIGTWLWIELRDG